MKIEDALKGAGTVFIDTAPIIYYIEAHPEFGPSTKKVFDLIQKERIKALTSVITLSEVLPRPVQTGNDALIQKFIEFLTGGKNMGLLEISTAIAEQAGRLRGRYPRLKMMDAIQIAAAMSNGASVFITNDDKLKSIKEIRFLVLKDLS
jgi:predicted nucleic acid-binding protein